MAVESFRSVHLIIPFALRTKKKKKALFNILIRRQIQIHNNDILKVQLQISKGLISIFMVKYA